MIFTFPPAPERYSRDDQNRVRRIIEAALRELERRVYALEHP